MEEKKEESPFGCGECAWKNESFEGTTPCDFCIRNPEIVSKRLEGVKEVTIKGIKLNVPRDMYISKEMLEFFKLVLSAREHELELLKAVLATKKRIEPTTWYYPSWTVTYTNDTTGNVYWRSYSTSSSNTSRKK